MEEMEIEIEMIIEKKIMGKSGTKYLVSGLPEAGVGDVFVVHTTEQAGTKRQNKLFHKLLHEIYTSRAWSFAGLSEAEHQGMSWLHFRDKVKLDFGEGAEYYVYQDNVGHIKYDKKRPNPLICRACFAVPVSWTKYTKEQRSMCIDRVMAWAQEMGMGHLCEELRKNDRKN